MIDIDCLGFVQFNLFKKGIVKDGYFLGLGQFNLFKKGLRMGISWVWANLIFSRKALLRMGISLMSGLMNGSIDQS